MIDFQNHHLRATEHLDHLYREAAAERLRPRHVFRRTVARWLRGAVEWLDPALPPRAIVTVRR